ncbi:hypothetical protein COCMIDRAFT_30128 [Bipolaris oryzae ATCC 44560]|uniref:Uncharacterized protein n=1 Tax=Bipolaris oryzae ATCC 44560 TaxID=930090 RepID=W6YNR0_COCMI|nr:uncharacterized protein COCMIDRAFT_30128 [Bipolaris oryzae ATCC 44560]EUC41017.1 hypothetical protein COCMIDRAFT_30128 [Bipolaris oryzae ATCC 44560]
MARTELTSLWVLFTQANVDVTFLIRPHGAENLSRPQLLYSLNDNQLKKFYKYKFITNPQDLLTGTTYDFIMITLDGHTLRTETGLELVDTIAKAAKGTTTKVIPLTGLIGVRSWLLNRTGLREDQVAAAVPLIHAYAPKKAALPINDGVDPKLLQQADQAYIDKAGPGLTIDNSTPALAEEFSQLWNASGISQCAIAPPAQIDAMVAPFSVITALSDLLDWPTYDDIDIQGDVWTLGIQAIKEILGLSVFGQVGKQAIATTTAASVRDQLSGLQKAMYPLDWLAFNKYHHSGKVNAQNRDVLRNFISQGEAENKEMHSTKELLKKVEGRKR